MALGVDVGVGVALGVDVGVVAALAGVVDAGVLCTTYFSSTGGLALASAFAAGLAASAPAVAQPDWPA